jgi:hypothetical protein
VKSALIRREIPDEIGLLKAVTEILIGISDAELRRVFQNWTEHVERVIEAGRDSLVYQYPRSPFIRIMVRN